MGILPKGYTLTSLEALKKEGSLNVQAGTAFVDFEFLEEVGSYFFLIYFPFGSFSSVHPILFCFLKGLHCLAYISW